MLQNSQSQMFVEALDTPLIHVIIQEIIEGDIIQKNKSSRLEVFHKKVQKRDSGAGVFLWIFTNFSKTPFFRTTPGDFFWMNSSKKLMNLMWLFIKRLLIFYILPQIIINNKYKWVCFRVSLISLILGIPTFMSQKTIF